MLCHVMSCYVMSCYVMFMSCHIMSWKNIFSQSEWESGKNIFSHSEWESGKNIFSHSEWESGKVGKEVIAQMKRSFAMICLEDNGFDTNASIDVFLQIKESGDQLSARNSLTLMIKLTGY